MLKWISLFLYIIISASQANAIGFGQAKLHSHLGEPLDVRVPILLSGDERIQEVSISLATASEYKNLEQPVPKSYGFIRADIHDMSAAQPEVYISSPSAVDESIIVLVLKVKRGRGNFYKRMQFFLDAADIKPTKKIAWTSQPNKQVRFTPSEANAQLTTSGRAQMRQTSAAPLASGWARRGSYGPVQYGDSLSEIAYRLRKDKRWSNRQVMLALFDGNQSAFVQNDINQLKKGSFLSVPDDAGMQRFVGSQRYQDLKPVLLRKKFKAAAKKISGKTPRKGTQQEAKKPVTTAQAAPRYKGRISLGLAESLTPAPVNPEVIKRLDKLEPMYQQAMATSLRMDDIGGKVDALTVEVSALHRKIDALASDRKGSSNEETSYGLIGFFLLLILNILLLLAYLYRKQMRIWQGKLLDAQRQFADRNQTDSASNSLGDEVMVEPSLDNEGLDEYDSLADEGLDDALPGLDTMAVNERDNSELKNMLDELSVAKQPVKNEIDHVAMFEEMIHKKDWLSADEHYECMPDKDKERPRIQALLVQKMHCSGDVMARNIKLLELSRLYEYDQWHRFCSYFDYDVWQEMQDEKIISFTGKVIESEMDKINQEVTAENEQPEIDEEALVLDLSSTGTFDIDDEDFKTVREGAADNLILDDDDSVIDMGSVVDDGIETIQPILDETIAPSEGYALSADDLLDPTVIRDSDKHKQLKAKLLKEFDENSQNPEVALELDIELGDFNSEQGSGEDDTVIVTPEMLAEAEKMRGNKD